MPYSTGMRLADRALFAQALAPNNYTGAAGAGNYISTKYAGHVTIVIETGAWAGGTAAVTINQATAVAGTGAKALAFDTMYTDKASVNGGLVATAVASNTFNLDTANATYVIEIDSPALDMLNGFDCLSLQVASPGSNNDYYAAAYILDGPVRYSGNTPPAANVD